MNVNLRRTWAEIDLDALAHNYNQARKAIGDQVRYLGVVKADAYGHGAVQIARELERLGADYLAVASLDEARELRENEICAPILILGYTPPALTHQLIEYGITQAVASEQAAKQYSNAASAWGKPLKVHIKTDTGMSRLGFLVQGSHFEAGVAAIARTCSLPNLETEGIFTHFAVSDEDDPSSEAYTREQFRMFMAVCAALEQQGHQFAIRHCANSGALARYPEMYLDMVRPGLALYGVGGDAKRLDLQPVMSLKSCISTVKTLDAGTDISYGRTFRTDRTARVGVLPIGYADGLMRSLSNRLTVHTPWGSAPICGRICMDMTIVDLTDLPQAQAGSEVEIFGRTQSVDELAQTVGTISYELLCAVNKRVPRLYMRKNRVTERVLRILP